MKILVTGASGATARLVASAPIGQDHEWVGVDPRPLKSAGYFPGKTHVINYASRQLDDLMKQEQFDAVLHLGRIRDSQNYSHHHRFELNVVGTQRLLELCEKTKVKQLVVLSTYHVYGAHRLNSLYLTEDSPLRAIQTYADLSDAVELDHASTTFMWKVPHVTTTVLRPVNVIGRHVKNTLTSMLKAGLCPRMVGFDPLMQFIDEKDMARAILSVLGAPEPGVYNVAGEGVIPLSQVIAQVGARSVPVPPLVTSGMIRAIAKMLGVRFPAYFVDFFKYPVILKDESFREKFQYQPKVTTLQALSNLRPL